MSEQRASVRVVSGNPVHDRGNEERPTHPPPVEPEALPPQPPPEPVESKDLGGPAIPAASPERLAAAAGGGLADQMRAAFEAMDATEEFAVPGWTFPDGRPNLILVARTFGDRRAFNEGLSNEVFIAKSTHKLLWVDDGGERHEIEGGWGPGLAQMLGLQVAKAADLVAMVISKPNPSQPGARLPNVAGIGRLANQIVDWAETGQRKAEEDLGE